jgi:hypothetical protein
MPIDGQGGDAPTTYDDLADFIVDNPKADAIDEGLQSSDDPDEDSDKSEETESSEEDEDQSDDDKSEEEESEDAKKQATGLKFKVPVKGEDGADTTIEVDEKELIAGYQRHSVFTQKTQALAAKEREAVQLVSTKLEEGRTHFMQEAQKVHATIRQLAALRSPEEMAVLAHTDRDAWIAERQRAEMVQSTLGQLEQQMQTHQQQAAQMSMQQLQEQRRLASEELARVDNLDDDAVIKIFQAVQKAYGFPAERFQQVREAGLVRMMRDAAAYKDLLTKRDAVKKKVADAPRLPTQRQAPPKQVQANKSLDQRFRTGKANVKDLGAWMAANKL